MSRFESRPAGSPSTPARIALVLVAMLVGFDWGGRLGRLSADLSNPDPEVRAAAVRELADHPAADVEALVIAALDDVDADVRLDAAEAAAHLGLGSAAPHLLGWLESEDDDRRAAAARALGHLASSEIAPALIRALGDARPAVRIAAIEGLRVTGAAPAAGALASMLEDADGSVRVAAAQAIGELGGEGSVFALATHASDEAAEVRAAIASSLGGLADPRASITLRRLLSDPSADVRLAAASALARVRSSDAVPELARLSRAVANGEEREVAAAAIAALGRAPGSEAFAALADAADSPFGELTSTARAALIERLELAPDATRAELVDALAHPEGARPAWVAAMLAEGVVTRLPEASAPLALLASSGRVGSDVALRALGNTGGDDALRLLLVALEDAQRTGTSLTPSLEGLEAYFSNEGPDGRATEPLLEALARGGELRGRVVRLLGRTASPRAAPSLFALLETEREASVLEQALLALSALDAAEVSPSEAARARLDAMLRHPESRVRLAAARALGGLGDAAALDRAITALNREPRLDRPAWMTAIALLARRLPLDAERETRLAEALAARLADEDEVLADAAREALVTWGSERALALLLTGLDAGLDAGDRRRAPLLLLALGRFEGEGAVARIRSELSRALTDHEPDVLAAAALMIGEHGTASDGRELLARWSSLPWPASAAASFSLARLARRGVLDASDAPSLCALTTLHDPIVRANVAVALAALGGRCEVSLVAWMSRPHAGIVRAAAARWLAALDPRAAARALAACLDDLPPPIVEAACRAPELPAMTETISVMAVDLRGEPAAHASVVVLLADGTAMLAPTDARGRLHLSNGPVGPLSLEEPSSLPLEP